jgi:hypothetical protein
MSEQPADLSLPPWLHIVLDLYVSTFAAHQSAYVLDSGRHVEADVTPGLAAWALREGHSLSGYMARRADDDTFMTHVGALDFDEGTIEDARSVRRFLFEQHHIPTLLVQSRRAAHLWLLVGFGDGKDGSVHGGQVPAQHVHRALSFASALAVPTLFDHKKVEVFPRPTVRPYGCGALRMPLMAHPKTGERYPAFDLDDTPITKVSDLLVAATDLTASWADVLRISRNPPGGEPKQPYPRALGAFAQRRQYDVVPLASETLALMGIEALPGRATFCPFHGDQHKSLSVAPDDTRVWCKAPSCVAHGDGRGVGSIQLAQMLGERT